MRYTRHRARVGAALSAVVLLAGCDVTRLVSVNSDGVQANDYSHSIGAVISADGRVVMFNSNATNLAVGGDTNAAWDAFVHDLDTRETSRVSVATGGGEANGASTGTAISPEGRYVVFHSEATDLVAGDTNGASDVFVHDRTTGETTRVSVATGGTQAGGRSEKGSISDDGNLVSFHSLADNLVPGDTNGEWDVFVHDLTTGVTTRVSVAGDGTEGDNSASNPVISGNGTFVAFQSNASNLVAGDTNGLWDVFVHDRATGMTTRVSIAGDGGQAQGFSGSPAISADGRYVAFRSDAWLVPGDTNGVPDIFVHDRTTGETTRVTVASDGTQADDFASDPGISPDGRYVTFPSSATNLVPDDTNAKGDAFVHDRTTGATTRVSVASDGTQANGSSGMAPGAISADGLRIVFSSVASNLSPDDHSPPGAIPADVFVRILDGD